MAQGTLQQMARQLQAYCPSVPYSLAQRWIIDRYRSITEDTLWSFKIGEGVFYTPASYTTGTVTTTNDSTTVTGSGTTWTSAMSNRQMQVGGLTYNFTYVSTTSGTLDRKWYGATTADQTYSILQAWITPADTDFHTWISVIDPVAGWRIRTGYSSFELDTIDPGRDSGGSPSILAARSYSTTSGTFGTPRFELWPYSSTLTQFTYMYERRVADLSANTDAPPGIIRSDILVKGALADLSRWPGSKADPNPMYDPYFNQFKSRDAEFREEMGNIHVADQNIYMTDLNYYTAMPYAPMSSSYMQNHAF
jgi:hypothetical protein